MSILQSVNIFDKLCFCVLVLGFLENYIFSVITFYNIFIKGNTVFSFVFVLFFILTETHSSCTPQARCTRYNIMW
jgi:hypothetical protein